MEIRVFQESETNGVIALWTEVFGYSTAHNDPARVIRNKLAFDPELLFVAEENGQIVGTVMGGYDGHRGWIYSLAVDPRFRRRGIARSLVARVEQALSDLGCEKVNLQLFSSNAATTAFYSKLGYQIEERISMGKLLGPQ